MNSIVILGSGSQAGQGDRAGEVRRGGNLHRAAALGVTEHWRGGILDHQCGVPISISAVSIPSRVTISRVNPKTATPAQTRET